MLLKKNVLFIFWRKPLDLGRRYHNVLENDRRIFPGGFLPYDICLLWTIALSSPMEKKGCVIFFDSSIDHELARLFSKKVWHNSFWTLQSWPNCRQLDSRKAIFNLWQAAEWVNHSQAANTDLPLVLVFERRFFLFFEIPLFLFSVSNSSESRNKDRIKKYTFPPFLFNRIKVSILWSYQSTYITICNTRWVESSTVKIPTEISSHTISMTVRNGNSRCSSSRLDFQAKCDSHKRFVKSNYSRGAVCKNLRIKLRNQVRLSQYALKEDIRWIPGHFESARLDFLIYFGSFYSLSLF